MGVPAMHGPRRRLQPKMEERFAHSGRYCLFAFLFMGLPAPTGGDG